MRTSGLQHSQAGWRWKLLRFDVNVNICFKIVFEIFLQYFFRYDDQVESDMISNIGNIAVNIDSSNDCQKDCAQSECQLCPNCINDETVRMLHESYREHLRRGEFKRIFPSVHHYSDDFISRLSTKNQISAKWFREKCKERSDWC